MGLRLFGTDGVRGVANRELTPLLAFRLGRAGAALLSKASGKRRPSVVIGRDTRVSGPMLEAALAAGIASVGVDVVRVGIVPTPAVAYLTRALGAEAGVMISASHNPVEDNGIKFFSSDGFKLPDSLEEAIERLVLGLGEDATTDGQLLLAEDGVPAPVNGEAQLSPEALAQGLQAPAERAGGEGASLRLDDGLPVPEGVSVGRIREEQGALDRYLRFLFESTPVDLQGLRVVVDSAYGAAFEAAPRLLRMAGAEVIALHDQPDGERINVRCGSTHTEQACRVVRERGAHVGFAHDGDADRVIAIDERGNEVNGDQILAICGLHLLRQGRLPHRSIAATVYSNAGLRVAFEREGGSVLFTKPGDRYVLEAMRENQLMVGGEQSGHLIFLDVNTTGDGLLTALRLLLVMRETGRPLSELAAQMPVFPQRLVNVRAPYRELLEGILESRRVAEAIAGAEGRLAPDGRVLVRLSGTEPVVRIMVEGPGQGEVDQAASAVAAAVEEEVMTRQG